MKVSEDMLYPFPLRRCGGCDDANDGVCQEVGDVRREVAGELGGKTLIGLGLSLHSLSSGEREYFV